MELTNFKYPNNVGFACIGAGQKYQKTCYEMAKRMLALTPKPKKVIDEYELGECLWWDYLLLSFHTEITIDEYAQDILEFCVVTERLLNQFPKNDWWLTIRVKWMGDLGFDEDEIMTYTAGR